MLSRTKAERTIEPVNAVSSLYTSTPLRADAGIIMIGERTNANGSKRFREAMLASDWEQCMDIAKEQMRDGAQMVDLCVDYVGRGRAGDMAELAGRFATASTLPIMLDSTEPEVIKAGLERLGGRCAVNSVNYEDGAGPDSRFQNVLCLLVQHGPIVGVGVLVDTIIVRTVIVPSIFGLVGDRMWWPNKSITHFHETVETGAAGGSIAGSAESEHDAHSTHLLAEKEFADSGSSSHHGRH